MIELLDTLQNMVVIAAFSIVAGVSLVVGLTLLSLRKEG